MNLTTVHILLVDDEPAIRRYLRTTLTAEGYSVAEAETGKDAIRLVLSERPALILLDLGLPDMDGVDVIRSIRQWLADLPIIILSVRDQQADKVAALDAGADDYLTKPFGSAELLARIRVSLRRTTQEVESKDSVFRAGELEIEPDSYRIMLKGNEIRLTPIEYEILLALIQNVGRVLTHHQLLQMVWGGAYGTDMHLLRVNISNLRRKIEPDPSRPRYLITDPGVGYRFRIDSS